MAPPRRPGAPEPSPLALRIRHAKENSGIEKNAAFAEACGFDGRAFWRYTTDNVKPSADVLREIARVGRVDLLWLVGNDPEPADSTLATIQSHTKPVEAA
jgi:transcriptional regulator with XRE-family HTH domain